MTHSPEPWQVLDLPDYGEDAVRALLIMDANKQVVAHCGSQDECDEPDNVANARLIAAAPKLLSALRALIWQIERDDSLEWEEDSPIAEMIGYANEAVAEAAAP